MAIVLPFIFCNGLPYKKSLPLLLQPSKTDSVKEEQKITVALDTIYQDEKIDTEW